MRARLFAALAVSVVVLGSVPQAAFAREVSVVETKSSMIMPQPTPKGGVSFGGCYVSNINATMNGVTHYTLVNTPAGFPTAGMILWYFNTLAYTGRTVISDATIKCGQVWGESILPAYIFRMYEPLQDWDGLTFTWQSWLGPTMTNNPPFTNNFATYFGPEISMTDIIGTQPAIWTIPSNIVQGWLDNPASNLGVMIKPDGGANKMLCNRAHGTVANRPTLTIEVSSNNLKPNTPTNQVPANGAPAQPRTGLQLTASPFTDPNGDPFGAAQWQVATTPEFIAPVWDSAAATASSTITVPVALQPGMRYWWRVRYRDTNAVEGDEWSAYSAPTYFDTTLNLVDPIAKIESMSAMILCGWTGVFSYADSNYNGRTRTDFYGPNGQSTNIAPGAMYMFWFDLRPFAAYTGMTVGADGDFMVANGYVLDPFPGTFNLREILTPWHETNVTWNNFVGPNWGSWTGRVSDVIGSVVFSQAREYWHLNVPQAMLQRWIDNPGSFYGLSLEANNANANVYTRRGEVGRQPQLTFDLSYSNAVPPNTPANVAPPNGSANQTLQPTLQSSAFSGPGLTHAASQWQIANDPSFAAPQWDSGSRTGDLLMVVIPSNVLQYSSRYYWRVRHISTEGGKSAYSSPTSFDTIVQAGTFTKLASANAMIKYINAESNFTSAAHTYFLPQGPSNGVPSGIVLNQFNLEVFQGMEATGPGQFEVFYGWVDPNFGAITFTPYLLLAPWNETSVTWNNFVGVDETNYPALLGQGFGSGVAVDLGSTQWTIDQSVIQGWLDGTITNYGIALVSDANNANALIFTRKTPDKAPRLTVDILPEPAGVLAALLAGALLLRRRR